MPPSVMCITVILDTCTMHSLHLQSGHTLCDALARASSSLPVKQDISWRLCLQQREARGQANQQSMPCRRNAIRPASVTVRTQNRVNMLAQD